MRKLILMALAGYLWKQYKAKKAASPPTRTSRSSTQPQSPASQ